MAGRLNYNREQGHLQAAGVMTLAAVVHAAVCCERAHTVMCKLRQALPVQLLVLLTFAPLVTNANTTD